MNYSVYETVTKKQSFNLVSQTDFFFNTITNSREEERLFQKYLKIFEIKKKKLLVSFINIENLICN